MKTILGYLIGHEQIPSYVQDTRLISIKVITFNVCHPATELLTAANYSDSSLSIVQRRVKRIKELGAAYWLDTSYNGASLEFVLQGCISEKTWYSARLDSMEFSDSNIKTLAKIKKAIGPVYHRDDYLLKLLAALRSLKAVEVSYDSDMSLWVERNEPSTMLAELLANQNDNAQ